MNRKTLFALLFAAGASIASPDQPGALPHSWAIMVEADGDAWAFYGPDALRVADCTAEQDSTADAGPGSLLFDLGDGPRVFRYARRFFNQGDATGNPWTSGDAVVYLADGDSIAAGDFEACQDWPL